MSATLLLAICILGCDFLLYVLYQWTYGERRRGLARRSGARQTHMNQPDPRPFLISSRQNAVGGAQRAQSMRQRIARDEHSASASFSEVHAYRRIAASLAQAKH